MLEVIDDDRSCPRFREFLHLFDFEFPGMKTIVRICHGVVILTTTFKTHERKTRKEITINANDELYDVERMTHQNMLVFMRDHFRNLLIHEVNEQIRYNGELPFDPHKDET